MINLSATIDAIQPLAPSAQAQVLGLTLEGRNPFARTALDQTIDLVAQGTIYRGHKLARIVDEYQYGSDRYAHERFIGSPIGEFHPPTSTKGWARLDVRVIGNPWGFRWHVD